MISIDRRKAVFAGGSTARRSFSLTLFLALFLSYALVSTAAFAQIRLNRPGPANLRLTAAPPAPSLVAPVDGFVVRQRGTTSTNQRLEWTRLAGNVQFDHYRVVLEEQGNPNGFVATQDVPKGSGSGNVVHSMILSPRYAGKVISWRVEACAGNLCSPSSRRTIRWTTRPRVPQLSAPAAGATAATRTPRFTWRDVFGASDYKLCVRDASATCSLSPTSNANLLVQDRNGSFGAPDLQAFAGRTVFWTAAACNSAGECSAFAAPRQLTIPQLQPPQLVRPGVPFIADFQSIAFEWRAPTLRPEFYTICVAAPNEHCDTNAPFKRERIRRPVRTAIPLTDLARFAGTTPNWTVGSCDASGCVWAAPRPLQIPAVPTVPVLSAPMDGYAHANRSSALPAMSWGVVPGATRYEFCTFPNGSFCGSSARITVDANRTSCSFTGRFLAQGHHFWTVRACNGAWGCSSDAVPFSFHMPAAPSASSGVARMSSSSSGGRSSGASVGVAYGGGYGLCR